MSRSKWKNFFIKENILNFYLQKIQNKKFNLKIKNKNMIILPLFLGMSWKIYNGKQYIKLIVTKYMIGYKFGEFINTRKKNEHKKK